MFGEDYMQCCQTGHRDFDMDLCVGLRGGRKQYSKALAHTFFFIIHNWLPQKLRFSEWHEISRCGIFPMAQNLKTIKLDEIEEFC